MTESKITADVAIVGGGVIGLTAAWLLAETGLSVVVVDKGPAGKEASWAGAGMLPPGNLRSDDASPGRRLRGLSASLWPELSESLLETTGIDNEYRVCGAGEVSLSDDATESRRIAMEIADWTEEGVPVLTGEEAASRFRTGSDSSFRQQYFLPTFAQVRNPRHLKALTTACRNAGVVLLEHEAVRRLPHSAGKVDHLVTDKHRLSADSVCITAGAWSGLLTETLGLRIPVKPVRGQMTLLRSGEQLPHILQHGPRYIVPRRDGLVLVGSTEEDVGFVKMNTAEAVAELLRFGTSLVTTLRGAEFVDSWSGLRPGSPDGLPFIGRLPELDNTYVAAGHFRNGLQQSTGTAAILKAFVCGSEPPMRLNDLEPGRSTTNWTRQ